MDVQYTIHATVTQGCGNRDYWVTSYSVSYAGEEDGDKLKHYADEDGLSKVC